MSSGSDQVFGVLERSGAGVRQRSAVLICSPWGWEDTASYRVRRTWGQALAEAGHPTLRIDLPGTGNSRGSAEEAERVRAWSAAIAGAAAWLRAETESSSLGILGLGIGGLLALDAVAHGAEADEIVLWGTPARGRKFVREIEAFAKMQAEGAGRGEETPLPEGWIEVAGFVLSAESVEELKALRAELPQGTALKRALVLDKDGVAADSALVESLRGAGVEVASEEGAGWGAMVVHPEEALLPSKTVEAVTAWFEAAPAGSSHEAAAGSGEDLPWRRQPSLELDGVKEEPIELPWPPGELFGIVAEPTAAPRAELCAVFLNAGAIRHIGPSRIWVENSRRWAARGVPCVRVDLDAIGESGDGGLSSEGIGRHYRGTYLQQVQAILDALEARGFGNRFALVGLCSGAYWAMQAAIADDRVRAAVMLNAGALVWRPDLQGGRRLVVHEEALRSKGSWLKLLRGEVNIFEKLKLLPAILGRSARKAFAKIIRRLRGSPAARSDMRELLDRLQAREIPVTMAFCRNEYVLLELQEEGIGDLAEWPNLELRLLSGEDHALGPIAAQESAREAIDDEFERLLDRQPAAIA